MEYHCENSELGKYSVETFKTLFESLKWEENKDILVSLHQENRAQEIHLWKSFSIPLWRARIYRNVAEKMTPISNKLPIRTTHKFKIVNFHSGPCIICKFKAI